MLLYLRIDIIEIAAGALLSECEGVEPELFFRTRNGSATRFWKLWVICYKSLGLM
jgi:hypothetical protein